MNRSDYFYAALIGAAFLAGWGPWASLVGAVLATGMMAVGSARGTALLGEARAALEWCSGANDFQKGGFAEIGYNLMVRPVLEKIRKEGR